MRHPLRLLAVLLPLCLASCQYNPLERAAYDLTAPPADPAPPAAAHAP